MNSGSTVNFRQPRRDRNNSLMIKIRVLLLNFWHTKMQYIKGDHRHK